MPLGHKFRRHMSRMLSKYGKVTPKLGNFGTSSVLQRGLILCFFATATAVGYWPILVLRRLGRPCSNNPWDFIHACITHTHTYIYIYIHIQNEMERFFFLGGGSCSKGGGFPNKPFCGGCFSRPSREKTKTVGAEGEFSPPSGPRKKPSARRRFKRTWGTAQVVTGVGGTWPRGF